MTAKEYLSRYRNLDEEINAKIAQVEELRRRAQTVGSANQSGVHSSLPYDRVGEITSRIVDLEREINEEIDRLVSVQREIKEVISEVHEERLRTILELRYINGLTFDKIAKQMNYSHRQIYRFHEKALEKVKMSLNVT